MNQPDYFDFSENLPQPSLAVQSGAAMWDADPRRNSLRESTVPASSVTSLIRSRKASMKRQKPRSEISVKGEICASLSSRFTYWDLPTSSNYFSNQK